VSLSAASNRPLSANTPVKPSMAKPMPERRSSSRRVREQVLAAGEAITKTFGHANFGGVTSSCLQISLAVFATISLCRGIPARLRVTGLAQTECFGNDILDT